MDERKFIRKLRRLEELSQWELAGRARLSQSILSRIECGTRKVSEEEKQRLMNVLLREGVNG